jgi:hypothetical protein
LGQDECSVEDRPVSNVIDSLPAWGRPLFVEVVGAQDEELMSALLTSAEPGPDQRMAVLDILSGAFCLELQPDDEPTERGVQIDNLLGAFLRQWPIPPE